MEIEVEEWNPIAPFRSFHKQFRLVARHKNIEFTFDCGQEEDMASLAQCSIRIDRTRFGQVVRNLLNNAFKFTPECGTVRMVVSKVNRDIEGLSRQSFVCLQVIDSGVGISKENQQKLFGKYVQFNAAKLQKGGGSGLGLWICKGMYVYMRMHAADI